MANVISVPVYGINSNVTYRNAQYLAMPGPGIFAQPVAPPDNVKGGNLIYSAINTLATGSTVFFSSLTVAQIITAANA